MVLFKKPDWIKPEINETKYWIHIAMLTVIVLIILKYIFAHDMLSWGMFLKVGVAVAASDIITHSLLGLK